MRSLLAILRSLVARTRFERDMRDELRAHIEHRADDLVAAGVPRDEAERRARIEFGGLESYKEQCRDASGFAPLRPLHGVIGDFRLATRRLVATPLFTIFAVLSLAIGLGVTTAAYSVVDAILWRDTGIDDADRIAVVTAAETSSQDIRWVLSRPDFEDVRRTQRSFDPLTTSYFVNPAVATETATEIYVTEAVDGNYFRALGVDAIAGRTLQDSDDAATASVVVIAEVLWRSRFGSDPGVVGKTVRIGGRPFEIVGVAPASFDGLIGGPRATRLWVPLATAEWFSLPVRNPLPARERRRLTVAGRLRPGVSIDEARAEWSALAAALDAAHPRTPGQAGLKPGRGWTAKPLPPAFGGESGTIRRFGLLIVGLVALVLAVACTNIANLVLARGTLRHVEFGVRRALGASRWRLVREQCAESLILAMLGGVAAYVVLIALMSVLDTEIPMSRTWAVSVQPQINSPMLAATAGALLLALFVFGLEPALQLTRRQDVRGDLAVGSGAVGIPKGRRQRMLLRWQVAISAGFFILASSAVQYLVAEARYDSGVDIDRIGMAQIDFYSQGWDEVRARAALDRAIEEARRQPRVLAAAASTGLPFGTTSNPRVEIARPGDRTRAITDPMGALLIVATPDFFRATGIAIRRGRAFDQRDAAGATTAIVLSESTARTIFGTADAVGRELLVKVGTQWRGLVGDHPERLATVVGVAEETDTTRFFSRRHGDIVYMPLAQTYSPSITLVVRADDPADALAAIRAAVRRADSDLALSPNDIGTGYRMLAGPFVIIRGAGLAALCLGAITLILAMVGLFGVQSHLVAHRTREIGVRMSFGATARQIRSIVLKDGYGTVLQGLALGLVIGFVLRAGLRAFFLTQLSLVDPWMFALAAVPLLLAAFCACYLPARRASRVDPNVALRHL